MKRKSAPVQSRFWKPKFYAAAFVQIVGTIALFTGKMDGPTYVALSTVTLAIFSAASVAENKLVQPPVNAS